MAGAPWVLEGNAGPTGSAHRWARDMLLPGGTFEDFDALAEQAAPGSAATLALLGPRIADYADPQLLWGGFLFPQANDILTCGRAEFARAVLENIAFAVRANLSRAESCAESAGSRVPALCGSAAGWRPVPCSRRSWPMYSGCRWRSLRSRSVSAQGAAVCAATGAGFYADILEAAEHMRQPGGEWLPRPVAQAEYLDAYERWLQAYETLSGLSQALG